MRDVTLKLKLATLSITTVEMLDVALKDGFKASKADFEEIDQVCKANKELLSLDRQGAFISVEAADRALITTQKLKGRLEGKLRHQQQKDDTLGDSLELGGAVAFVAGLALRTPIGAAVGLTAILVGKAVKGLAAIKKASA